MMTNQFPAPKYRLSSDILAEQLDDETVFLHLANERYYTLDDVGTRMLAVLIETQDMTASIHQVAGEYGIGPKQVAEDFTYIVNELIAAKILVV
ncbi:PqqD family peptide modification chaperone [bacterium]|nr:PqqD family peptide modification chaperone [bacterium]